MITLKITVGNYLSNEMMKKKAGKKAGKRINFTFAVRMIILRNC